MLLAESLDPVVYAKRRAGIVCDPWQRDFLRSCSPRVLLNCARQSGKTTNSALLASYEAERKPNQMIVMISPSDRQSGELFRRTRRFLRLGGVKLVEDNARSCELANGSRIVALPSSSETIRGFSAVTLLIEDESAFCDDRVYTAIRPMLAVSKGRLILQSTPFGKRGHFHKAWAQGGERWQRVEIAATMNPRIDASFLEEERQEHGLWLYEQEYCCKFVDAADSFFSDEMISRFFDTSKEEVPTFDFQKQFGFPKKPPNGDGPKRFDFQEVA